MSTQESDRRDSVDATEEFTRWLRKNNLHMYSEHLAEEGYDDLRSLCALSEDEVEELCITMKMRPGHMKKMPLLVNKLRLEMEVTEQLEQAERERQLQEIEEEKGSLNGRKIRLWESLLGPLGCVILYS